MYGMIFINLPVLYHSNFKSDKLVSEYSKKYLTDLTDFELNNFERIYQGAKDMHMAHTAAGMEGQVQTLEQMQDFT